MQALRIIPNPDKQLANTGESAGQLRQILNLGKKLGPGLIMLLLLLGMSACKPAPRPPYSFEPENPESDLVELKLESKQALDSTDELAILLNEVGLTIEERRETIIDYLGGDAEHLILGPRSFLQVHRFVDEPSRIVAGLSISPDGYTVQDPDDPDVPYDVRWPGSPHAFQRGRMLAIYIGDDPLALRALEAAFGPQFAGAPIPEP